MQRRGNSQYGRTNRTDGTTEWLRPRAARATVHPFQLLHSIRHWRMGELQRLPPSHQSAPERGRRRRCNQTIVDRVDDHERPHHAEQLELVPLRPILLHIRNQLQQTTGQRARVARHHGTGRISAGLTRTNNEELNDFRQLSGCPEDDVHQHIAEDRGQNFRLLLHAEQPPQPLNRRHPGAHALIDDVEEQRRKHRQERVNRHVIVLDVSQLMREHRLDLAIGHAAVEQAFRRRDHRLAVNRPGGEGVRQRVRRDVDPRLELQAALGIHAIDNVDQLFVRRNARVGGNRALHRDSDFVAEPPENDGKDHPERTEAELEFVGEAETCEGREAQAAHRQIAKNGLEPSDDETATNRGELRVIVRNDAMSHESTSS